MTGTGSASAAARPPLTIGNVSIETDWGWLDGKMPPGSQTRFVRFEPKQDSRLKRWVKWPDVSAYRASLAAAIACRRGGIDLLVSHIPMVTARTSLFLSQMSAARQQKHLAFSFNFTTLPTGAKRLAFAQLFKPIHRFVVFSKMELGLYPDYFGIPAEKIEFQHWCVEPPEFPEIDEDGDFLLAVGRTGRDYGPLMRAMARLPKKKAIVVASPYNLEGLSVPPNVEVRTDIPFAEVLTLMRKCRFSVLPLERPDAPFGHGALVLAMYARRALVVTRSPSFREYVTDGESCLSFGSDDELIAAIETLWQDPGRAASLAETAYHFAHAHCHERHAVQWFDNYLNQTFG